MRINRSFQVRLSKDDREEPDAMLSGGLQVVHPMLRTLVLRRLDESRSAAEVAAEVRLASKALREIGRRHGDESLEQALYEQPRPGAVPLLDASQKQRIIAMVCSEPPEGRIRWTCPWWPRKQSSGG